VTDAQILALAFLVPQDMLLASLELIDTHGGPSSWTPFLLRLPALRLGPDDFVFLLNLTVHCVTAPYGSELYTVAGSSHPYLVSPRTPTYCPCPAFAFSLVSADSSAASSTSDAWAGLCKHLLALRIALALDAVVHDRLDTGEKGPAEDQLLGLLQRLELAGS
jgi:predicted nucleic acid-binding Zn finger protein